MITERDAMEYEVFGSAWTGFIPFHWLRVAFAWLIARRVATKYARYRAQKEYGASVAQRKAESVMVLQDNLWPPTPERKVVDTKCLWQMPDAVKDHDGTIVRVRQNSR